MSEFPIEFSPTLGALAKALSSAQGELQDAKKDSVNPHFKNRFASLSSVRQAITPVFAKCGLAVVQLNEPHGKEGVCVVTLLLHESGEWIRSRLYVPVSKADPQGFGSAISYARRYALAAIANISSDDDDDAEHASKPTTAPKPASAPSPKAPSGVDVESLVKALAEAKDANELAKAILAVGRAKDKMSKEEVARCVAARDARVRELESSSVAA